MSDELKKRAHVEWQRLAGNCPPHKCPPNPADFAASFAEKMLREVIQKRRDYADKSLCSAEEADDWARREFGL